QATHTGDRLMMCAYAIRHPKGVFLFDTGIGSDPVVDEQYWLVHRDLDDQLAANGLGRSDVVAVANELLDGEAPIWPGLTVIPTPGHTAGHQSLVVETRQGRVVLAGQSF